MLVCCLLLMAGCWESMAPEINIQISEPSIASATEAEPTGGISETAAVTKPEKTQATDTAPSPTEPQATELTKSPTQPTDPTEPSKPEQTIPKPTEPACTEPTPTETVPPEPPTEETVPPTTELEQTQPTEEALSGLLDYAVAMAYGNNYAADTYAYCIDPTLHADNAGYEFPYTASKERVIEKGGQEYLYLRISRKVDSLAETLSKKGIRKAYINCWIYEDANGVIYFYVYYG